MREQFTKGLLKKGFSTDEALLIASPFFPPLLVQEKGCTMHLDYRLLKAFDAFASRLGSSSHQIAYVSGESRDDEGALKIP